MSKKYELTGETKMIQSEDGPVTLHRIRAVVDFGNVKAGEFGGWIESEKNLPQEGNAWVHDNASVYGEGKVTGNAHVYNTAQIYGNARISEYARIHDNAQVSGNARVYGGACVFDEARVYGNSEIHDYCFVHGSARVYEHADVSGDARISGDARVYGNTKISEKARISGNARVYGDTVVNGDTSIFEDSHAASEDKVSELIHTLEENDMPEHARMLKDLCGQVDTMSEQLQEMSVRLSEAEWQLRESGIDIHEAVAALKKENRTLRERLSDIRKSLVSKAADIMESVKKVGRKALYRTIDFTGVRFALYDVQGRISANIDRLDETIDKIDHVGAGTSLRHRKAGQNIRDAFRALRGEEDVKDIPKKGRSKTDMLKKPFETMREKYIEIYIEMEEMLTASMEDIDRFEEIDDVNYRDFIDNTMEYYRTHPEDRDAFIEGVEMAKDFNASNITLEDLHVYDKLIEERAQAEAVAHQAEVVSRRTAIRQDIRGNGFKATKALVANMEHLNEITGKHNTLKDVKEMAKDANISAEVKETVNEVVENLQQQEVKLQAPEPPAVEPA